MSRSFVALRTSTGFNRDDIRHSTDSLGPRFDVNTTFHIARPLCDDVSYNLTNGFQLVMARHWRPALELVRTIHKTKGAPLCLLLVPSCPEYQGLIRLSRTLRGNHESYMTLVVSHVPMSSRGSKSLNMLQSKISLAFYRHL